MALRATRLGTHDPAARVASLSDTSPTENAPARLMARHARGQVARAGLANPTVVLGTGSAQVADLVAMAARREVPLGALTLEDGAPADIAADGVVNGPELLLHDIKVSQAFTASFSSWAWRTTCCATCPGTSS